jgi:hypothetical protein
MRLDLSAFAGKSFDPAQDGKVEGSGLLELTTHSVQRVTDEVKDFGMIRIVEIFGGDPNWNQETVTYNSLCRGQSIDSVLNSQMIIDVEVSEAPGSKTLITISNPVLQRMINGRTKGLAIQPLGAINACFYTMENKNENLSPRLYFNLQK